MTRDRIYGSDTEFCAWMRQCKDLPSCGRDFGFVASDNDVTVHRYKHGVKDSIGTRDVQGIMQIEVKTRRGKPPASQMDTLSKLNLFRGYRKHDSYHVRFFGVFVLVLSRTNPDDSDLMWWGKIPRGTVVNDASRIEWVRVDYGKLIRILRFDIHPYTFEARAFRRHHLTQEIFEEEVTPLGFKVERRITKRS